MSQPGLLDAINVDTQTVFGSEGTSESAHGIKPRFTPGDDITAKVLPNAFTVELPRLNTLVVKCDGSENG